MIEVFSGKPGSGKTLKLASVVMNLLHRNEAWFQKSGVIRKVWSNLTFAPEVQKEYAQFLKYWVDPLTLITAEDCDIVWDEIATHLDSAHWQSVPLDLKRFLQQHRKRGIDIYGTTQSFAMVDVSMRRLVDSLWICRKLIGSRNPSPTKPKIQSIWGVIWLNEIVPETFEDEKPKKASSSWLFITRGLVEVYDTRQQIEMGIYPPLKHIVRECIEPDCDFRKITHQ